MAGYYFLAVSEEPLSYCNKSSMYLTHNSCNGKNMQYLYINYVRVHYNIIDITSDYKCSLLETILF